MKIEYPIPLEAVLVLNRVQADVPQAIVAGGCLRDAINERPINDIDFFVPDRSYYTACEIVSETHPKLVKTIHEAYFVFNNDVREVRYYEGEGRIPVNVIAVTEGTCTPEQQLGRFDFGICKVAWDGKRLWKDLAFDRDQADETFTLLVPQTDQQRDYSMQRYGRLQAKYRGWKFVDGVKPWKKTKIEPFFDNNQFGEDIPY
jgi:hypothetical protein